MIENEISLIFKLDTKQPIEVHKFASAFVAIADEFEREVKYKNPDLKDGIEIFVKDIHEGSIIASLIPGTTLVAPFIAHMDQVLIVEEFVRNYGKKITALATGNLGLWKPKKTEFHTFIEGTKAIASDSNGSAELQACTFEDGERKIRSSFKFTTKEAKSVQSNAKSMLLELDASDSKIHERVLMVFTRSDVGAAKVGKRSGERVRIESISDKTLPIMYASDLAEQKIKHEIREAEENIYKKAFIVDVKVELINQNPAAYSILNLHDVIDISD